MALKYMELYSMLLILREMPIKATQIYHFLPSRLEKSLKPNTLYWWSHAEIGIIIHFWW